MLVHASLRRNTRYTSAPKAHRIHSLVNIAGLGAYQFVAVLLLCGFAFVDAAQTQVAATLVEGLEHAWDLSKSQAVALLSSHFVGQGLSMAISGYFCDLYGRRKPLILAAAGMAITAAMSSFAFHYPAMLALQFLSGTSCGLGTAAALALLSEVSTKPWRPVFFAAYNLAIAVGDLYALGGTLIWMPDAAHTTEELRSMCWWVAGPAAMLFLLAFSCLSESAHWCAVDGNVAGASAVLHRMACMNASQKVLSLLGEGSESVKPRSLGNIEPILLLPPAPATVRVLVSPQRIFDHLLRSRAGLQKLAIFAALSACGAMITSGTSCIWPQVLSVVGGADGLTDPVEELMSMRAAGMPAALVNVMMLSQTVLGHRHCLVAMSTTSALSILGVIYAEQWSRTVFMLCGMVAVVAAGVLSTTCLVFLSESFPTQVRASAIGISLSIGRAFIVVPPLVLTICGRATLLHVICLALAMSAALVLLLSETKGLDLEDFMQDTDNHKALIEDDSLEELVAKQQERVLADMRQAALREPQKPM